MQTYGSSVAINGDTIVMNGIPADGSGRGAAYVFVKPAGGWVNSTETAKLTESASGNNGLAASVSISGNTIVATDLGDLSGNFGTAFIYTKPAGGWVSATETAALTPSDGYMYDSFGNSVFISGNTVVVGAPQTATSGAGEAYVFVEPAGGWINASETAKLTISNGFTGDQFGSAVSTTGNTVIVGAPGHDSYGAAYVYVEPSGGWATTATPTAELTAADRAANYPFGDAVANFGNLAVIGAPLANYQHVIEIGSAFLYVKPASGWVNSTQSAKLNGLDFTSGEHFGAAVALGGGVIAVGEPLDSYGKVYVFGQ